MATSNNTNYNICENWGLRCFEQKATEKSVILKCSMNKKKKDSDQYTAPVYIDVICPFSSCDIKEDDYAKTFINVWGQFSVGDYTNKNGETVPTLSIFATKVTKSERK